MSSDEASDLRATLGGILEPLYQWRVGTVAAPEAIARAIALLQQLDSSMLTALYCGQIAERVERGA